MRHTLVAVVDDHSEIRELIAVIVQLGFEGVDVRIVLPDRRLFERETWEDVDAALVDMNMPFAPGDEVLQWLAHNKPSIRRVAMSADARDTFDDDRLEWVQHFLCKPFYRDQLEEALGLGL